MGKKEIWKFSKGYEIILKKIENKKDRSAIFVCSLSFKSPGKKQLLQ